MNPFLINLLTMFVALFPCWFLVHGLFWARVGVKGDLFLSPFFLKRNHY